MASLSRRFYFHWNGSRVLSILFAFLLTYAVFNGNWLRTRYPIQMDANGYYIYLPAVFIYHDLEKLQFVESMPAQFDRRYFLYRNIHGGYLTKYSPGIAIMQTPFFLAAHFFAPFWDYPQSGYSPPYRLSVVVATIFYTLLAFLVLRKLLIRFFSDRLVSFTLVLLALGTNIFFYAVLQAGLVHNYLLLVFSLMLLWLHSWWITGKPIKFVMACGMAGFMALIRPTEALAALVPAGFLFARWQSQNFRIKALADFGKELFFGGVCFLLALLPLLLYWKSATGNWIAYTYEQEGFYFDRPSQLFYGLFGFRKGWFIYTPVAALAMAGSLILWKEERFKPFRAAILAYMPVNIFIVLSWYCWWYGGCFGQRAFIPGFALLSVPMALTCQYLFHRARFLMLIPCLLIALNLFQSFQYQRQILHMDSMTWPAYQYVFGKWKLSEAEKAHLKSLLDPADYSQRGKKLNEYFR